jgi:hypothetical protein
VTRNDETGFAVHFLRIERELENLVLSAAGDAVGEEDDPDASE